ncbi:MAG: glutaminyl-peptide cyclotransferase, partial [Candidatus Electrothrix sp. ATG2]|nr:glutaminyl-peptide cyclotransferase [Candidatus Electrothrix sp. ATG2]
MNARLLLSLVLFLLGPFFLCCGAEVPPPRQLTYTLIRQYPHDPKAFTQGLAWDNGEMYEGTGLYGRSSLRRVDLKTGLVHRQRSYTGRYF